MISPASLTKLSSLPDEVERGESELLSLLHRRLLLLLLLIPWTCARGVVGATAAAATADSDAKRLSMCVEPLGQTIEGERLA